jgi:hypothetical protein
MVDLPLKPKYMGLSEWCGGPMDLSMFVILTIIACGKLIPMGL